MTATYNADNTITELPGMEKPAPPFVSTVGSQVIYQREIDIYNAAVAKCRTIPCSPSCRGLWAEGQVLEEGRDYEVRPVCVHAGSGEYADCLIHPSCERCVMTAFPLSVKSDDDRQQIEAIIRTALVPEVPIDAQRDQCAAAVVDLLLQHNFIITKR